jgi:hypothetical protein
VVDYHPRIGSWYRSQITWNDTHPELFYWRTASGQEVEVVLEDRAGRVVGVEVKASATLSGNDACGLQALADTVGKKLGAWCRALHRHRSHSVLRQLARRSHEPSLVGLMLGVAIGVGGNRSMPVAQ